MTGDIAKTMISNAINSLFIFDYEEGHWNEVKDLSTLSEDSTEPSLVDIYFERKAALGSVVCMTPLFGFIAQKSSISIIFIILSYCSVLSVLICLLLKKNKQYTAFNI